MSAPVQAVHEAASSAPRLLLKGLVFAVCVVLVAPLILAAWLEKRLVGTEVVFVSLSQLLSLVPALPGTWLRGAFYWGALERCSWQVHVGFGSIFSHRGARLGERASIGSYCVIGHADVGDAVMIGSRVSIPSGKRQHFDDEGRLSSGTRFDRVTIGEHAWLGEGAIVLADVGARSVVSAGAVVTRPMPAGVLVGGNPARVIRSIENADPADGAD
jgi:acetyltransferase-like isoleucine patch superfamily enzyme